MKDSYIRFRCPLDNKTGIEKMAKNRGKTITDYMLWLWHEDLKKWGEEKRAQMKFDDDKIEYAEDDTSFYFIWKNNGERVEERFFETELNKAKAELFSLYPQAIDCEFEEF